jgi:hypothetical protein
MPTVDNLVRLELNHRGYVTQVSATESRSTKPARGSPS